VYLLHKARKRTAVADICRQIRPNAVLLVEAFHFSDALQYSAIGRYDGNIYPALMRWAEFEPLSYATVA
jgi:acyl-CoA oxidase